LGIFVLSNATFEIALAALSARRFAQNRRVEARASSGEAAKTQGTGGFGSR
jgi:hypothetical protein